MRHVKYLSRAVRNLTTHQYLNNFENGNVAQNDAVPSPARRRVREYCRLKHSSFRWNKCYPVQTNVAEKILRVLKEHVRPGTKIVELYPGYGVLTNLLSKNFESVEVWDDMNLPVLQNVIKNSNGIVAKRTLRFGESSVKGQILEVIFLMENCKDSHVIFVHCGPNRVFFRYIIRTLVFLEPKFLHNFTCFFIMTDSIYSCFIGPGSRLSKTVDYAMMDVFFNIELVNIFNYKAFTPKFKDSKNMVCVKITRKKRAKLSESDYEGFLKFVQILSRSKSSRIIPSLEQWLPGSGPYFISKGIGMTLEVAEMSVSQLIYLYKWAKKLSGFKSLLEVYSCYEE